MTNFVTPIAAPALQPLANSFEYDQLESELKAVFSTVFESLVRDRERNLNMYGMAHIGGDDLMASSLKADGIAMVRRSSTRMQFLMKAERSRNPRRGLLFIKKYLQSIWPNIWVCEPLWQPVSDTVNYPSAAIPLTSELSIGSGVTADYAGGAVGDPVALYRTDGTGKNLLYTTPRTNALRNNTMQGAVSGTPGTLPTNWTLGAAPGLTQQVVGVGSTGGISYIDVRVFGTPTSVANSSAFHFDLHAVVNAAVGESWTASAFIALIAGSLANVANFGIGFRESDAAGTALVTGLGAAVAPTATLTRYSETHINTNAGTAKANCNIRWTNINTVSPVDFTLRIGMPQLEQSSVATSPIPTTNAAVTVTDYSISASGVATFASGPPPTNVRYFRTSRTRITLPVSVDNGLGLTEIAKAFRSTLAARLMLEFKLGTVFDNSGNNGGLALANATIGIMPITLIGTLQN
jgi:hypothetical protein